MLLKHLRWSDKSTTVTVRMKLASDLKSILSGKLSFVNSASLLHYRILHVILRR